MVNSMNDEQHNGCNDLFYFPEVGSTNTWAKEHLDRFGPVGAVYTTSPAAFTQVRPSRPRPAVWLVV